MTACSDFLPGSTVKPKCIYRSRPGIKPLYLHLPGVHVEDNRLLPLRYHISLSPAQKRLEITNPPDRPYPQSEGLLLYTKVHLKKEINDFLASGVGYPCYLVATSP
jgi:hypothetical protein